MPAELPEAGVTSSDPDSIRFHLDAQNYRPICPITKTRSSWILYNSFGDDSESNKCDVISYMQLLPRGIPKATRSLLANVPVIRHHLLNQQSTAHRAARTSHVRPSSWNATRCITIAFSTKRVTNHKGIPWTSIPTEGLRARPVIHSPVRLHARGMYSPTRQTQQPIVNESETSQSQKLRLPKSEASREQDQVSELGTTPPSAQEDRAAWSGADTPTTAHTDVSSHELTQSLHRKLEKHDQAHQAEKQERASTTLAIEDADDVRRFLEGAQGHTERIPTDLCGSGCCKLSKTRLPAASTESPLTLPDNEAFRSLNLKLDFLSSGSQLDDIYELPKSTTSLSRNPTAVPRTRHTSNTFMPPSFVQPHPPHDVFSAPLVHARQLTRPGALKTTYHFDLDVTDYPAESGDVDFKVGGAIGVCPSNPPDDVEQIFNLIGVPRFLRDQPTELQTTGGRWPTIWGEEQARTLTTTQREILTWCSDIQSGPPTKALIRLLADHASDLSEQKVLMYLCSAQGQAAFCDLRTRSHISLLQLLKAFPSSRPPFEDLISHLNQLMPRFYSLSQDPQISCNREGRECHKVVEFAVTVHHMAEYDGSLRTGVGSGFLERLAKQCIDAEAGGVRVPDLGLKVPMFRGLMANPLAREFVQDGPMLLIGAGVGIAPFRGFVQRRLQSANCVNKVWVLQGVRDSLIDELYSGEWGLEGKGADGQQHERVKKVVESRVGQGEYVQDEVRRQEDLVWEIVNSLDGRIFVCGAGELGKGVEEALVDVARAKGNLGVEEANEFWEGKKKDGQFVMEIW